MPKNPSYDVLGGDTPGTTPYGSGYGPDIDVSKASYETAYDFGKSLDGKSKSILKKGYSEEG